MTYTFHYDAGHGWLQVPIKELYELRIREKISSCSYVKNGYVYLEEDLDAGIFIDAYVKEHGRKPYFREEDNGDRSPIREYHSYHSILV